MLKVVDQKEGGINSRPSPSEAGRLRFLGPSWIVLGARLGALGAILGPSWDPYGAPLGHLGDILKPHRLIGTERARRHNTWKDTWCLNDVGFLGSSLGGSERTVGRV